MVMKLTSRMSRHQNSVKVNGSNLRGGVFVQNVTPVLGDLAKGFDMGSVDDDAAKLVGTVLRNIG